MHKLVNFLNSNNLNLVFSNNLSLDSSNNLNLGFSNNLNLGSSNNLNLGFSNNLNLDSSNNLNLIFPLSNREGFLSNPSPDSRCSSHSSSCHQDQRSSLMFRSMVKI